MIGAVVELGGPFAHRVSLADPRGDNRFLRVTWHPEGAQFVISHWQGDVCLAATRVADDTPELLALLANGLASSNTPDPARWDQTG